ncbi:MAG: NADP-dependent oxidoreductase [Polyangiaceae bacterium]|nr:NADP-dependent oxidoreductase [Polyangiaceae bacterium]
MRAYVLTGYGGPASMQLRDIEAPVPGRGEVLIRVHAAGLNPLDFKTREGKLKLIRRYPLPIAGGNELSGVIESLGPGATRFQPGDRVFTRVDKARLGAFAEVATVEESLVAKMPEGLDFETAAAVPLAALTALQALRDELRLSPGQHVFISAGAGGVGTYAIQIAKWLGANVTTTASPKGEALVKRLGADRVVDYTKEKFEEVLRDYDGAFDLVGGETLENTFRIVKPGATVVSVAGMPEPTTARKDLQAGPILAALFWFASRRLRKAASRHGARYRYLFMHPSGTELTELASLIDQKKLEPIVDKVFSFDEIGEAFAYLEAGHAKGKIVIRLHGG